jgi:hypothetical protein
LASHTDDSLVGTCALRRLLCPSSFEELVALLRTEKIAAHALVVALSPLNALLPSFVLAVIPRAVGVLSHEYALQLMGAIETTAAAAGIIVLNFGADGDAGCLRAMKERQYVGGSADVTFQRTRPCLTNAEQAQFDSIRLARAQDVALAREIETEMLQDAEPPSAAATGAASSASATSGRGRGKRKSPSAGSSAQSADLTTTTTPPPFASKDAFRVTADSMDILRPLCPAGVAVSINSIGECQFAAVGVQLQPQRTHREVRGAVCAFAAAHPDLILDPTGLTLGAKVQLLYDHALDWFTAKFSRAGEYGDDFTLLLSSIVYNVRIIARHDQRRWLESTCA